MSHLKKWKLYSKYGTVIDNMNIVCFKCPMDSKFDNEIGKKKRLYIKHAINHYKELNIELSEIIDLTNTD